MTVCLNVTTQSCSEKQILNAHQMFENNKNVNFYLELYESEYQFKCQNPSVLDLIGKSLEWMLACDICCIINTPIKTKRTWSEWYSKHVRKERSMSEWLETSLANSSILRRKTKHYALPASLWSLANYQVLSTALQRYKF